MLGSKLLNSWHFWNNKSVFLQILHHSSLSWDITSFYFFSWNCMYFQQKEHIKVQIRWNFKWAIKSVKFCTLMGSSCPNNKVSAKKVQKSYLSWHWRVMQSLKQNWLLVSNMTWGIRWVFTKPLKSLEILPRWARFSQVCKVWAKKKKKNTVELSFVTLNSGAKFEYPEFVNFNASTGKSEKLHF